MVINNKEIATRIKFGYSVFFMVYLTLLVVSMVMSFFPNSYLFEIILSVFCIGAFAVYLILGYTYIYFSDVGGSVVLRYQALNPFIENPKSIEIDKNTFVKYEVVTSFFGLKESLVLFQKSSNGVAKYPPVGINSLRKIEKEALLKSLNALAK